MPALVAALCAALVLAGCIKPHRLPEQPEAAKTLRPRKLRLGLILSDSARKELQKAAEMPLFSMVWGLRDALKPFDEVVAGLDSGFQVVMMVDSESEAKVAGADLIGELGMSMGEYGKDGLTVRAEIILRPIGGREFERLKAESTSHEKNTPGWAYIETGMELRYKLQAAIALSESLDRFEGETLRKKKARLSWGARELRTKKKKREAALAGVDRPSYRNRPSRNSYALIVGIEDYANVPSAAHALRDAESVRRHMLALGVPMRNILHLAGEKAGRVAFEKYIETWLPRNVRPGARVYFYFAGHGTPDAASKKTYLLPWDGDLQFLENTGYPVDRLYAKLDALKASEVIVMLDTCFSGAGGRSLLPKGARPLVIKAGAGAPLGKKLLVLLAAGGDQITGVDDRARHGLFTFHLLKALNERKGRGSVGEVFAASAADVEDAARRQGRPQTPSLLPKSDRTRTDISFAPRRRKR